MPVRCSTPADSGVVQGTPASMQATWTGRRAELTRARTAMSPGSTPPARQAAMVSTARPASASAGALTTATGPHPVSGPPKAAEFVGATSWGVDVLLDAACVVGEEVTGGTDDRRWAAVVDRQVVGAGAGEVAGVVDEELGRRAGVAVNDLVVVADPEAVVGGSGQEPDEEQVGGVEVLELVDQQMPALGLSDRAGVGIGQQDLDGPVDLLVEVDRTGFGQRRAVRFEAFGDARRVGDQPPRPAAGELSPSRMEERASM